MKLGPVPKIENINITKKKKKKKKMMMLCWQIVMPMSFFQFMVYLQPSPEAGLNFH